MKEEGVDCGGSDTNGATLSSYLFSYQSSKNAQKWIWKKIVKLALDNFFVNLGIFF